MTHGQAATLTGRDRTIPVTVHITTEPNPARGLPRWAGAIEADANHLSELFFDDDQPLTLTLTSGATGLIHLDQVNAYGEATFKGDGPPPTAGDA